MIGPAGITYENTVPAVFLKRLNRFTAQIELEGRVISVHVKNTGRLGELLLPGARVTLQRADNPARKTPYDLISVYREPFGWVNIDSQVPNRLHLLYLKGCGYDLIRPEYAYGDSRLDFYMERGDARYLTEVKGCTLAFEKESGTGYFPDAPTERGVKHLRELARASREGFHCAVAFVIAIGGVSKVLPNRKTQPEFALALEEAAESGVQILHQSCRVSADSIEIIETRCEERV